MRRKDLIAKGWKDYELLDSGNDRKLERFGQFTLIRPETQALWQPLHPDLWRNASAEFRFASGKGSWKKNNIPEAWELEYGKARFTARLTSFKHVGVFPEQAPNWDWLSERVAASEAPKVLNLFGYTGIASIAAALAGAKVTHVDASKQSNAWAKANAELSGVSENIRWILDDALKFTEREARRGEKYDGILLDPPAFGRGAKGEVWKIEESLPRLMRAIGELLSPDKNAFFLLNGYAAGYSPQAFLQCARDVFSDEESEYGELHIAESASDRVIPSGIYVRFVR